MSNHNHPAVGIFRDRNDAGRAIFELRRAGYEDKQVGFIAREDGPAATTSNTPQSSGSRLLHDAPILSKTVSVGQGNEPAVSGGALADGLSDTVENDHVAQALVAMGLPEDEAAYCQREFEAGHTVITVDAPGREQEALNILYHHHAYNACHGMGATPNAHFVPEVPS